MDYRTRVKFCGITRLDDALLAVELGVDAVGFVFYAQSPRYIDPASAMVIVKKLPAFVTTVGLFVDAAADVLEATLAEVPLDVIQFHGAESPNQCAGATRPYIKAIRMADDVDLEVNARSYASAQALLVDTYKEKTHGGTGAVFDWNRVPAGLSKPVILAGGLDSNNVAAAITQVEPYAVDVSSGIEQDYGIKDPIKMRNFMNEVSKVEH